MNLFRPKTWLDQAFITRTAAPKSSMVAGRIWNPAGSPVWLACILRYRNSRIYHFNLLHQLSKKQPRMVPVAGEGIKKISHGL